MELSSPIFASPIKQTFAQESRQHLEQLQGLIAELDNSLHDIDQLVQPSRKTEDIIRVNRLLQESATKADFYKPSSLFVKLSCRLEQVIGQLGDRQFVPIIDPITQDLLQQLLTMMAQLIDDYCQENDKQVNQKIKVEREKQITQLLSDLDKAPVSKLSKNYPNEFLNLEDLANIKGLDGNPLDRNSLDSDPFSIDADSEELHLFDLDLDLDSQEISPELDLAAIAGDSLTAEPEGLALVPNSANSQELTESAESTEFKVVNNKVVNTDDALPMPELLANIFHEPPQEKLLGNDDETELQGTVWSHHQEDLTTVAEIIDDWQKPRLPEPWGITNNDFPHRSNLLEKLDSIQDDQSITAQNFFDEIDEIDELDESDNLDIAEVSEPVQEMIELGEAPNDQDKNFWGDAPVAIANFEQDSNFLLLSLDQSEDGSGDLDMLPDYLPNWDESAANLADFEQVAQIEEMTGMKQIEQAAQFAQQDFDILDIDTAIEESPIYQNYHHPNLSNQGNRHDRSVEVGANDQGESISKSSQISEIGNLSSESANISANSANSANFGNSVMNRQAESSAQISENHCYGTDLGHDATVRIPLPMLEDLGDLSEEIAVRNSNLEVYLEELRSLYDKAQQNLHTMTANMTAKDAISTVELKQAAIAGLHNNFEQIVGLINHTEQQTQAMVRDICHLRRSFQQLLKHPISSLVGKFPRILRELSLRHGKQVELIVQGADIRVERSLSEVVAEVLDVLLINAFEHGIESPDERQLQGKPLQGKIEVIAAQVDTQTTITIKDDGYGLNINDLASTSKAKLQKIQTKLQEIDASLTMQSWFHQGSEFTLILPNSCSVNEVIVITINQISIAINSNLIVEVVPMDRSERQGNLLPSQFVWNEHSIPLISLDSLFQLNCLNTSPDIHSSYSSVHRWSAYQEQIPAFLIIDYQNHLFALQTDGCTYKQEGIFQQVAGDILLPPMFSGTIILGDGRAVPLLNPTELINRCLRSPSRQVLETVHSPLHNISSLSDFFDPSDDQSDDSNDRDDITEPENLESSGLFVNGTEVSQPSRHEYKKAATRVLLVESSANVRRYLAMALDKFGFVTEQVQNTQEAIAFLAARTDHSSASQPKVDVIISDLDAENIDSFQFIAQIRASYSPKALPIIILSSRNSDRDRQLALERGANAYFSKPSLEQELITTLQKLVSP